MPPGSTFPPERIDGRSYDVVVVGGGVVGCAIARALSFSHASVAVLEAAHDVGEGASKGNTGITTCGADCTPGTLEAELVCASAPRWEELCASLDTPFARIGTLCVALDREEAGRLEPLQAEARANGARAEIVSGDAARRLEPLVSGEAVGALHLPGDGIVDSLRLTLGYAELACANGVEIHLLAPVTGVERSGGRIVALATPRGRVGCRWVVNAAGIEADTVSRLCGGDELRTWPRQGQYWLLDREVGSRFCKVVGGVPDAHSRGIYAVPTTNGSLLLGPTADDRSDRADRAVDAATLEHVFLRARALVPSLSTEAVIKTFAANRPACDRSYHVQLDAGVENLVHAAGIRSTGVSSSPAVAERVRGLLAAAGAPVVEERDDAVRALPALGRLLGHPQPEELVERDARYGAVVCACEQVSAAEIAAAFAMRVPARSLDGLRKRTRAGGGRCQGAMCLSGLSFLASIHGGQEPAAIAVGGPGATVGVGRVDG